ncbi:ABC transporter substrate-binding protein [Paracoccus sp. (in: a-proteobacteria)]|uniref:ABC transporter substrate-binding protein n=1 Tax=Paracoccus sp. TaxID=267 RepID=UPI0026E11249|nr:ABC transporter substrate-binding protein [Paracoccus sp. (in: a-proteobacteria)]MDO5369140.1 ABC transporter substrate-binding protein [Paracoccus sp. (in: a-proteobacteria)]
MHRPLILAAMMLAAPAWAQQTPLVIVSWGGDFAALQDAAMARPFTERTGRPVRFVDTDDPAGMVKAQVEAGNVSADVASVGQGAGMRLCEEGDAEPIDPSRLAPAPGGSVAEDFLPGTLTECFVATDIYSTVIAYDAGRLETPPATAADFFDLQRFPGRRGLGRTPQFTMELALVGDGVPLDQVYDVLATPEGVDRALAKLDTIRDQIVWWEAGAQPIQLLADGEVALAHAYNGRVFKAAQVDGLPLAILWDAQMLEVEGWVIPKGAPNPDAARDFVAFSTSPEVLAHAAEILPYGPPRRSAQAMVGNFTGDGTTPMGPHLPTAPDNMTNALFVDPSFWADHETELRARFTAWLGSE